MTSGSDHDGGVPDWRLERHLLGELSAGEAGALGDAVARDGDVRERVSALEQSSDEILRQYPPNVMAASIRARLSARGEGHRERDRRVASRLQLGLAAAATLAAVAVLGPRATPPPERPDVTRPKGGPVALQVYRSSSAGVERLLPGGVAREHDVLQLAYHVPAARQGAIVSVDATGVVTRHLPAAGAWSVPLEPGASVPLPDAYELDAAPGYERFVLVTADRPFPVEVVEAAVKSASTGGTDARLELPPGLEASSFVLRKESGR
jgi:hypothetical protein